MAKTKRKKLVEKLDKAVSEFVRKRDKKCVLCGRVDTLQAGHVFSRRAYATRWDYKRNVFGQCGGCNLKHTFNPIPYYTWYKQRFSEQQFNELYKDFVSIRKWTDKELEDLLEVINKESID